MTKPVDKVLLEEILQDTGILTIWNFHIFLYLLFLSYVYFSQNDSWIIYKFKLVYRLVNRKLI